MIQPGPEESEKTRSREAVRGPPPTVVRPFERVHPAPDCFAMLSCSGPKPRLRRIAKRHGSAEIAGKRHEFPGNITFSNYKLTTKIINRLLFQKTINTHELSYKSIHKNPILYSILYFYNHKRH